MEPEEGDEDAQVRPRTNPARARRTQIPQPGRPKNQKKAKPVAHRASPIHPSIHPSRASLQWRKAARPEFITWDDVKKEGEEGKQYLSGRDRHGRAVLIARPGRDGGREQPSHVRFLIYTLEHATWSDTAEDDLPLGAHAEHTSEKLVVLINFTGWTLATAPPMKTARETLAILQEHYPERLAVAVCYNPPWIFAVFWKAISPFIDPNTYRKIRFVNPKREKEVRRMRQMFDMSCVDEDLGGDRSNAFDARAFGDKMRVFDARKAAVLKAKARR